MNKTSRALIFTSLLFILIFITVLYFYLLLLLFYLFLGCVCVGCVRVSFGQAPADGLDLLGKLMVLNPGRRLTALQALNHPFVSSSRGPRVLLFITLVLMYFSGQVRGHV